MIEPCLPFEMTRRRLVVAHGIAMDPQQLGHILAGLGSSAGQQIRHLQRWFLVAITFAL
jgi:hypothetical protein